MRIRTRTANILQEKHLQASRLARSDSLTSRRSQVRILPDSLNSLVIHMPRQGWQLAMHPRTAEPWTTTGNTSYLSEQLTLLGWTTRLISLRCPRLTEYTTSSTFRDFFLPQLATHLSYRSVTSLGTQKFPCTASVKMVLSKAWPATSFFSREFSFWRALSGAIPPTV